jgi:uncharacterized membrane protein
MVLDVRTATVAALAIGVGGVMALCIEGHAAVAVAILVFVGVPFVVLLLLAWRAVRRR